jgi:signal transduction histidine kinase
MTRRRWALLALAVAGVGWILGGEWVSTQVSESLANVAKYARPSGARVALSRCNGTLRVEIVDDGVGGADASRGSGLRGLEDRVSAVRGSFRVETWATGEPVS